ncbi:MAG TPA: hypothetical protein VGK25_14150 [Ignavibacteria bacterium]
MIILLFILVTAAQCLKAQDLPFKNFFSNTQGGSPYSVSIAAAIGLYLLNPIVIYESKKLYMGITKEFSIGFGYFGEHRIGVEYSFIIGGNIRNYLRASYKYDMLLNKNLKPSNSLQGTGVFSIGAGYFYDFDKHGAFPEFTYGYSLRNHKLLLYPHIKLRHTFMFKKEYPDITDISFGLMVGIANPFIDLKIRKK